MRTVLQSIRDTPGLRLQIVATGMHLDPNHGDGMDAIRRDGWIIERVIPWEPGSGSDRRRTAAGTARAMGGLVDALAELKSDVVLVAGDRVEAFAAASAGHLSGKVVAHVHGGDRAAGQADDTLRHAITKLAHVHFPATRESAQRLYRLGEDRWRIRRAGSPGVDGIVRAAASRREVERVAGPLTPGRYALLVLHPVDADEAVEAQRARTLLKELSAVPYERIVVVYPNNDPGCGGILRTWDSLAGPRVAAFRNLSRHVFLGLMRDAAVLAGNSSSGIIEAASFGTPVLDVGPRQQGRERGANVTHVTYDPASIRTALRRLWNDGRPRRCRSANPYGGGGAGRKIADTLVNLEIDERLLRKLIRY